MNYYIFRHGQTHFSKFHIPYGNFENTAEILKEEVLVTQRLAEYLSGIKTDVNISSPYLRCRQTVKIVEAITGKKFIYDARLRDFGQESIEDMGKRIQESLESIKNKNYKNVSICTHGYPIAVLTNLITKGSFTIANLNNYPACGVLVVIKGKKIEEIDFN